VFSIGVYVNKVGHNIDDAVLIYRVVVRGKDVRTRISNRMEIRVCEVAFEVEGFE